MSFFRTNYTLNLNLEPEYIYFLLISWIRDEYDNPEVVITENGWSDDGQLKDTGRIDYLRDHLREVLRAVVDDDCNVTGYTVWSILDNFEWARGFT